MKLQTIILTTDLSDAARAAFPPAVDLARRFGARIDLVHVLENAPGGPGDAPGAGRTLRDELERRLRDLSRDGVFEGVAAVHPQVIEGYGAGAVARFAEAGGQDLIVAATHGRSGVPHLLLGSFVEKLVRTAPCPVLTWRAGAGRTGGPFHVRRILYPHDFSELSGAALDAVRFFAASFDAEVDLFHVLAREFVPLVLHEESAGMWHEAPQLWKEAREWSMEELRRLAGTRLAEHRVRIDCATGSPAAEIVRQASKTDADLVVLATHGRGGIAHALAGSVAERVVRASPCPTLTVRPEATGS